MHGSKELGSYFVLIAKLYHQNPDQIRSLKTHLEGARDFARVKFQHRSMHVPFPRIFDYVRCFVCFVLM